jgi:transcriptional regulator GlxA family with amidase domain
MAPRPDRSAPQRIAIVAFDGLQALDLTGPWEVFQTAGRIAGRVPELICATPTGRAVHSSSGLTFGADAAIAEVADLDTLIVAGGDGVDAAAADPGLVAGVARLSASSRRTAGVCSGALLLAAAGLLDGRRAVTHWSRCDQLAVAHPAVTVERDPIFVRDGDVITSAGVTAGMDLALALVEEDLGRDVALATARMLVLYARRPGGQSQFSVQLAHQIAEREPIRDLQAWIAEHPDADLSAASLAARLHLSERQLSRVFRRELGTTPAEYVEGVRIERARSMLELEQLPLERVAERCGFASAEVMRRAFHRRVGVSPRDYRMRFGPPVAA